ncbi:ABC transporter substrate-binding protein [Anabaena sp. WFMT]|uniref:ABC transporter substrate-binding protein n=1 Tax=Anabaena sp. WFMT TaxID=3449730 RepID=UPI003F2521EA
MEGRQEELELTPEDAAAIETVVLEPIEVYKRKLQRYELALRNEIEHQFPLNEQARADLKRLQKILGLRNEDIALVEAPILAEQTDKVIGVNINNPPNKNSNFRQLLGLLIGIITGGGLVYILLSNRINITCEKEQYSLNDNISLGEEILLKQDTNRDREAGVKAFLNGDCLTAINKFNSYRQANLTNRTDPEALIYLNNAEARKKGERLKIAVSVPIGLDQNIAKEILRGVAQAQDEVNNSGGIKGKALEVAIANDDNDPGKAVQIATHFVKDPKILAVIGHNSSNASLAAAPVYQQRGLVMMSPTSFARNLSGFGSYIFRTAPSVSSIANTLSHYVIKTAGKTNILICSDSSAIDGSSFKDVFIKAIGDAGGRINSTNCDISAPNFNAGEVISQAISNGADGLVLAIYVDTKNKGLGVAQANKGRLTLLGSSTLATYNTLQKGKADINGIIVAVPWHPTAIADNPFASNAMKLWGGRVNWRTATAYDATLAITKGLKTSNTRNGLQKALYSSDFSVDGATGKIQFLSGDRRNTRNTRIDLLKVQQKPGTDEYDFVPIQP